MDDPGVGQDADTAIPVAAGFQREFGFTVDRPTQVQMIEMPPGHGHYHGSFLPAVGRATDSAGISWPARPWRAPERAGFVGMGTPAGDGRVLGDSDTGAGRISRYKSATGRS